MHHLYASLAILTASLACAQAAQWVVYTPPAANANGKHIVLLSGDEEYRSEEGLPQMGRILSQRHGFKCTVLFDIDPATVTARIQRYLAAPDIVYGVVVGSEARAYPQRIIAWHGAIDDTVNGRPIKAVVQLTKQAMAFVFDRTNGKPVWPIEERPVPKSDVPGEWTSPTQPFPTKPVALVPQGVTENDLVDFTPEIKAEALRVAKQFRLGGLYKIGRAHV